MRARAKPPDHDLGADDEAGDTNLHAPRLFRGAVEVVEKKNSSSFDQACTQAEPTREDRHSVKVLLHSAKIPDTRGPFRV